MRISLQNISKSFGGNAIVNDFSLEIPSESRLCLCGFNGSGKSTLLRLIAAKESLDAGRIILDKNCRLGFVEQHLTEDQLKTPLLEFVLEVLPDWRGFWQEWEEAVAQNDMGKIEHLAKRQAELEQIYGYNPEHRAKAVLSGLGFAEHKWELTLQELSGGWRERAKLARVLTQGADVLLLDEPTNHLDLEAVEWLETFLLEYKGSLVFVAHDRIFMDKLSTHILFFSGNGRPMFRKGNFSQFLNIQEEITEQRAREATRLQNEIAHKMDFVRRFKAKASKARQAASKQKMAKRLEKELDGLRPEAKRRDLDFAWPTPVPSERTVLSVADLGFSFPDGKKLWEKLTFSIYRGQKIALVGPNGCGKSTLLKLIVNQLEKDAGSIVMGQQVRLGYFNQHLLENLHKTGTVLGEIRRLSDPKTTEEELMSVLGLFQLGQNFFERFISSLSGGECSRLMLGALFLSRSNFLVLDEPTNHLDLESREALVEALDSFEGTLLMVAHDRHVISTVADEIWELTPSGFTVYQNGYEEYYTAHKANHLHTQQAKLEDDRKNARGESGNGNTPGGSGTSGLSREALRQLKREQAEARKHIANAIKPLQKEKNRLEKKLEASLEEQHIVETTLADPELYADSQKTTELLKTFHTLETQNELLLEKLEKLEQDLLALEQQRMAITQDDVE